MYIYPSNLKARATLLLWPLRDVAIIVVLALLGVLTITQLGSPVLLAVAGAYAVLAIRFEDSSILDFLKRAWRFIVTGQQHYTWRWTHESAR